MNLMKRSRGRSLASTRALLLALSIVCGLAVQATIPAQAQTLTAAWTQQKFGFTVLGFQSRYTCFGLSDYIERILLKLGARKEDLVVGELGCDFAPPPSVRASFWQLRPLSPNTAHHSSGAVQPVQAHWEEVRVSFDDAGQGGPDLSGCELAHQAIERIMPYFVVRNARFDPDCREHSSTPGRYALRAEVLLPGAAPGVAGKASMARR
jgi:hypothetical protein